MNELKDVTLLERVSEEVSEIKAENNLTPDQPVKYEPMAWTRQGFAD